MSVLLCISRCVLFYRCLWSRKTHYSSSKRSGNEPMFSLFFCQKPPSSQISVTSRPSPPKSTNDTGLSTCLLSSLASICQNDLHYSRWVRLVAFPVNFKCIWRLPKAFAWTFHVCSEHSIQCIYQNVKLEFLMVLRLCLYHSLKSKACQICTMFAFSALSKISCTISL